MSPIARKIFRPCDSYTLSKVIHHDSLYFCALLNFAQRKRMKINGKPNRSVFMQGLARKSKVRQSGKKFKRLLLSVCFLLSLYSITIVSRATMDVSSCFLLIFFFFSFRTTLSATKSQSRSLYCCLHSLLQRLE